MRIVNRDGWPQLEPEDIYIGGVGEDTTGGYIDNFSVLVELLNGLDAMITHSVMPRVVGSSALPVDLDEQRLEILRHRAIIAAWPSYKPE